MKLFVGQKPKACDGCLDAGKTSCPKSRKPYCYLWMRFKKNSREIETETSDESDDGDDTNNVMRNEKSKKPPNDDSPTDQPRHSLLGSFTDGLRATMF
ncbi:hypothetical protein M426DRAFT_325503 [Hypoxylon sp. CI-4A]|nr:hypothetical protein M426DRAFT_325503 [Hypoxylon sp. CI-4A]